MSNNDEKIYIVDDFDDARRDIKSVADRIKEGQNIQFTPNDSGLFNTHAPRKQFTFIEPDCCIERIGLKPHSEIVFCQDRPSDLTSGWGGKGAMRTATIDIVVGRMAAARDGAGPEEGSFVHNSFGADAARIYVSQMTNVYANFALAKCRFDKLKESGYISDARSAVGIKADHARMIGREGIKLVTGKGQFPDFGPAGETNSRGGRLPVAGKIEFIAGNNTEQTEIPGIPNLMPAEYIESLQPVPKGDNLVACLAELSEMVELLIGSVFNITLNQVAFNSVLGIDPLRPWVPTGATASNTDLINRVFSSLWQLRVNKLLWNFNYLESYGYKHICSSNVNTT